MEQSGEMNHLPTQTGIWVKYTGFRYKDTYDVKLRSGKVYKKCFPNADSFHHDTGKVKDTNVVEIRLCPDAELDGEWDLIGEARIENNCEMFDIPYPLTVTEVSQLPKELRIP